MVNSVILDPASSSQKKCVFNLPQVVANSIKIAGVGVYGAVAYFNDPVLGALRAIERLTVSSGGQILSEYTRKAHKIWEYQALKDSNIRHRSIKKGMWQSNYGFVSNSAGPDVAGVAGLAVAQPGSMTSRCCVDKHHLKKAGVLAEDSDLAICNLADLLGFFRAKWSSESVQASVVPMHLFSNLKLTVEFAPDAEEVATGCTAFSIPYLVIDQAPDSVAQQISSKSGLSCSYADWESEESFLGAGLTSKTFLNGYYGKTIGELVLMASGAFSHKQDGQVFKILINNEPYFNLSNGVDTDAKIQTLMRLQGFDLCIPAFADRKLAVGNATSATDANGEATSVYEGPADAEPVETNYYNDGRMSYLSVPIQAKIDSAQIEFTRTNNDALTLEFWAQIGKIMQFSADGSPLVSYV